MVTNHNEHSSQGILVPALLLGTLLCLPLLVAVGYANFAVEQAGVGQIYTVEELTVKRPAWLNEWKYALLLGASVHGDGRLSGVMSERVSTAAAALANLPVTTIVLSGDGSGRQYDEVAAARSALLDAGFTDAQMALDPDGVRTIVSLKNYQSRFGSEPVLLVSHRFHLRRALYLARELGITARGIAAGSGEGYGGIADRLREIAARLKAWLEVLF